MMLNLIKVKFLGAGEAREFGGEASPPPPHVPPLDEIYIHPIHP